MLREDFDVTARSGGVSQSNVAGEEVDAQRLCECDIRCVVDRQVVAQFPAPAKQRLMRRARDRRSGEVCKSQLRAPRCDRAEPDLPAQYRGNFDVKQFRCR